ncbi:ataxin-1-like [Osmerus eperlanus]|uniref:ataxin-1-like n=1 Tax=Osmerus eperlanus TaxID=29151 RepID=UPI002E109BB8
MNPSPDRGKECLPPKKRESRQGSADQRLPLDEFKSPAPLRTRPTSTGRGEGGREASDGLLTNPSLHFLPSPPPLPAPAPSVPLPLPWPLAFSPSVPLPYLQGQVGERRGSVSPSWRDEHLPPPIPRWLREGPLTLPPSPSSSSSSFKSPYSADSREMWSYYNTGRRDYSSPLFSPSHLLSHGPLYPPDLSLAEGRHRYLGKRPNGLDGPGSRTASASRALPTGEYSNDLSRTRLDSSAHGSHANGRRRNQEEPASRSHSGGPLFPDSLAQEGPDSHSSLQDRDPREAAKISSSPQSPGTDPQVGRGVLLDPLGGSPVEAHIYYSLGSVYPGLQQSHHTQAQAQAYPLYSPSGTPLYREPGARLHSLRNSQHSPQGQLNSHGAQLNRERDREREQVKDRERERDKEKHRERDREKGREQDRERERERERESERERQRSRDRDLSPGQYLSYPPGSSPAPYPQPQSQPPALLPHFAKGSLIELAGGRLKRVEELRTEDFLRSADTSPEFHLSTCTVLLITHGNAHGFNHLQVLLTDRNTQELLTVLVEYPFFVRDQGWSSCCPQRTLQLYGLPCRQLTEGDVCLALTPTPRTHTRTASRAQRTHTRPRTGPESNTSREEMPPPPPPPPLPHHALAHPLPPPPPSTADRPVQEQPRPRKRRWSAPDLLPPTGTDKPPPDLPHGSKQRKWQ